MQREAGQAQCATSAELRRLEQSKFALMCQADAVAGEIAMSAPRGRRMWP